MSKHTSEPWRVADSNSFFLETEESDIVCRFFDNEDECYENNQSNAKRIIECVNAFAGIEDPEKYVKESEIAIKTIKQLLSAIEEGTDCGDRFRQSVSKAYISHIRKSLNIEQ